ncbi:MAG TPA: TIGR00300 family protein [Candidatus Dormibacteraeota bacterium]|jgi:lysine-ketoglutarate reductase/saccharopine dehydrogenase-like protein (TIGR00300 family)|nr:TIGR00300 family protein [Candidatus Dormibacteraeota bacterium]
MPTSTVELSGHIIDSMMLPRIFDAIMDLGGSFRVEEFRVGQSQDEQSYTRIAVTHDSAEGLEAIVAACQQQGAVQVVPAAVQTEPAPRDGVFPDRFYSTSNQPTQVRIGDRWVEVENIEMDCAVVLAGERAHCVAVSEVHAGDPVVVGHDGIKVQPIERSRNREIFGFMTSQVSSEKPKHLVIRELAETMREIRGRGGRICFVGGPAIIHTGAGVHLSRLIRDGWVDVLFAGNALAAHDVESQFFGTSLGIDLRNGLPIESGHEHHIRAINRIRAYGGIPQAVQQGVLTEGVMYEATRRGIQVVLAGSVRDDGPLPDVVTDMVEAQRRMRAALAGVELCIMCSTMLHAIATGNMLAAAVKTVCVDINPAVVTKLADRGSSQTLGLVTDVESFLRELSECLV